MFAKIITPTGITVFVEGYEPFTMTRDHKMFEELEGAALYPDIEAVIDIIHMANKVTTYSQGKVQVVDGELFFDGEALHGALVDRILSLMDSNEDSSYLVKFLENLMQNPSRQSREELYLFLEACDLPITTDGRFIAYKWVRDNYTDSHTGKFDNSVGQVLKMDRSKVDDNRQRTCSAGLHVCSRAYGKFSDRLMLVAVNPAHVVSVPYDYNNSKMRVCEYEVIQELPVEDFEKKFTSSVYRNGQPELHEDDEDEDYYYSDVMMIITTSKL